MAKKKPRIGKIFDVAGLKFSNQILTMDENVRAEIYKAFVELGKSVEEDFNSTVEYWEHKPEFIPLIRFVGGEIKMRITPMGSVRGVKYWQYVNNGTAKRYVIFHPKYEVKTQVPGSFYTNVPGYIPRSYGRSKRGRKYKIVGKSFYPLRGIRPRNWTKEAAKKYRIPFAKAILEAIRKGADP